VIFYRRLLSDTWFLVLLTGFLIYSNRTLAADPFIVTHYTDEHGLPQNSIKGIGQDNLGFIWLISEKGPIRYDGNGLFKTFGKLSTQLRSDRMLALHRGKEPDELWAQSEHAEMILLKNGRAVLSHQTYSNLVDVPISDTAKAMENVFQLPSQHPEYIPLRRYVPVGQGSGFVLSKDSITLPSNHLQVPPLSVYFPHERPWHFVGYRGKLLYLDRLYHYTAIHKDGRIERKSIAGDVRQLPSDTRFTIYWNIAADQLFLYAANRFYQLSEDHRGELTSTLLLSGFDAIENDIKSIFYMASNGKLFLGSATKGLFIIKERLFRALHTDMYRSNNAFYNQTHLGNGLLLTNNGIAFEPDGKPQVLQALQDKPHQYHQIIGPDGNLWIFQHFQILIVSPHGDRILAIRRNPAVIRFSYKDAASRYWFGGEGGKLMQYLSECDSFATVASFPSITYISGADIHRLLIGTQAGLFIFDKASATHREVTELRNKSIRSIYTDSNRHWITTYQHGFFLYENGQVTAFPIDKDGYLATSHCILEDQRGFFWISTNKGLFKVSKQQLLDYKLDATRHPFYFYYSKQWGFSINEFNGGCEPCAVELPDGRFSFPSLHGLVQFNPLAITDEFPTDAIILDQATLDGKSLPLHDTLQISRLFSRLDLKVATPFYGDPYNIQIDYLLQSGENRPKKWLPINNLTNTLSFNELSAGHHEVRIRMRNGIGPKAFHYATFHLYVPPLFHETGWFAVICCLFLCALVWLITSMRTRFVLNQNQRLAQKVNERTADLKRQYDWQQRLSASITHDIRTPLNYVVRALEHLQHAAKARDFLPDEMAEIYRSTEHIYHYSNNLTQLAKVSLTKEWLTFSAVSLHSVTQRQISTFTSFAASRGNVIHNRIPTDTVVHSHADVLSIIIHNVLDNAVKFTNHGEITLSVENQTASLVMLRIADTGVGLTAEQIQSYNDRNATAPVAARDGGHAGLGLLLVKDMARLIRVDSTMESVLGCGTVVTFMLPRYLR